MSFAYMRGIDQVYERDGVSFTALRGFDLAIEEGEFCCLLGPSGCGKTTALNLLAGFESPSSGDIVVAGREVRAPGADRGVVFQSHDSLFDWLTALENIEFGLRMGGASTADRRATAERCLALVGLSGHGHKRPHEMSGGMKQRVQIARVFANDPAMLLMDEPFGALDSQTRRVLQRELTAIWETNRKTVVFITHDIEESIILGTKVAVMYAGPASRIKEIIEIDPAMGHDRNSTQFAEYYRRIQMLIEEEVNKTLELELH